MTIVYGHSDDLVLVESTRGKSYAVPCFQKNVVVEFTDGTIIKVSYPKPDCFAWLITTEKKGYAPQSVKEYNNSPTICSDIFHTNANVKTVYVMN